MKDDELNAVNDCRKRNRICVNPATRNWARISFNDFGVKYSQDFIDAKEKEKTLWKSWFSQKHMKTSLEE